MENLNQQEKLPITSEQIKEFVWWHKRFSGKWKTVNIWPGETETTFKSYEKDGKKYINAKNELMDATRIYNPEENTISVFYDHKDTLWRVLAEDWQVDQKKLETDLKWFKDCVPTFKEKLSERIKNVLS